MNNITTNMPIINKNGTINGINSNGTYFSKKYVSHYNMSCDDFLSKLYNENKDKNKILLETSGKSVEINTSPTNKKINDDNFTIPKYSEYYYLNKYNYNLQQLKSIAKEYKLKVSGNKQQLTTRILSFLFFSNNAIKMQSIARMYLQKKYNSYHGPAFMNRSICVNTFDFLSMEDLKDIPYYQFFSYKDNEDGLIYGFDLLSLYNLLYKTVGTIKNPFNTKPLAVNVVNEFRSLIRVSRLFKIPIITDIKESEQIQEQTQEQTLETRIIQLFHNIDLLGNYSQPEWFSTLNRHQIIKLMRELLDIWQYRAPLTFETKRNICPPNGNPFMNFNFNYIQNLDNLNEIKKYVLNVLEKFINSGIDRDSKSLGAFYVLGAITLVNSDAAIALPWLYQAVCYI
jgi:hypothetical protein